jgi:hypothetical protein
MRTAKLLLPCLLLWLSLPATAARAENAASLKSSFSIEAGLLDEEIATYGRDRSREKKAAAELQRLNTKLDELIEDPNSSLSSFSRLEEEVGVAIEDACQRAKESAAARQRMYKRMRRLSAIVQEYEMQEERRQARSGGIAGVWRIEAQPIKLYGIFELEADNLLVTGTYRLSNGKQGSIRGTLVATRLELQMIDSRQGAVASVKGLFDSEKGEIRGRWLAFDLSTGRPSQGDWTGRKAAPE